MAMLVPPQRREHPAVESALDAVRRAGEVERRLAEARLRLLQVPLQPPGVAQQHAGAGFQVREPLRALAFAALVEDRQSQQGQAFGARRVLRLRVRARAQEQVGEVQAREPRAAGEGELPLGRVGQQLAQQPPGLRLLLRHLLHQRRPPRPHRLEDLAVVGHRFRRLRLRAQALADGSSALRAAQQVQQLHLPPLRQLRQEPPDPFAVFRRAVHRRPPGSAPPGRTTEPGSWSTFRAASSSASRSSHCRGVRHP